MGTAPRCQRTFVVVVLARGCLGRIRQPLDPPNRKRHHPPATPVISPCDDIPPCRSTCAPRGPPARLDRLSRSTALRDESLLYEDRLGRSTGGPPQAPLAAFASVSAAAISSARAEDGRDRRRNGSKHPHWPLRPSISTRRRALAQVRPRCVPNGHTCPWPRQQQCVGCPGAGGGLPTKEGQPALGFPLGVGVWLPVRGLWSGAGIQRPPALWRSRVLSGMFDRRGPMDRRLFSRACPSVLPALAAGAARGPYRMVGAVSPGLGGGGTNGRKPRTCFIVLPFFFLYSVFFETWWVREGRGSDGQTVGAVVLKVSFAPTCCKKTRSSEY